MQWSSISSSVAIQMVRAASGNRPILLLVDETLKLGKVNATVVLTAIGRLLDEFNDLHCVISTLDLLFFEHVATTFGRPIKWVKLTPPNMSSCLRLLGLTNTDALSPIAQCIFECNGHLRALGRLLLVWRTAGEDHTVPLSELIAHLLRRFATVRGVPDRAIIDALLGRHITRSHVYGQDSVADLIAGGALLNYETISHSFVGRLSLFILRAWLRDRRSPLAQHL